MDGIDVHVEFADLVFDLGLVDFIFVFDFLEALFDHAHDFGFS